MLYVPKELVADVRQQLARFRRFKKLGRALSETNRQLFALTKKNLRNATKKEV